MPRVSPPTLNLVGFSEMNEVVMTLQLIPVPFRGTTLYVIPHEGQPFTPMKPIVEGMELDWKGQFDKIMSNEKRWGMVIIPMPSKGGIQNSVSLPLRKLPGWLMSIHPNKVKPDIKDSIIAYQNECDDVLWQYWSQGTAVNPRLQPEEPTLASQPRLHFALRGALRAFDLSKDAWGKQIAANQIKVLCGHLGVEVPNMALIGKPIEQYQLEV